MAAGVPDMVQIPMRGSAMGARGGAGTLQLARNRARLVRRGKPRRAVLTRTNAAMRPCGLGNAQDRLRTDGADVPGVSVVERAAFRNPPDFCGAL